MMGLRGVFLFLLPCLLPLRSVRENPENTDENCVTEYGFPKSYNHKNMLRMM